MKYLLIYLQIVLTVLLSSCHSQTNRLQEEGDTVCFRYAEYITVVRHQDYTEVTLANPWKPNKMLHRYLLVPKGKKAESLPDGTIVRVPLQRAVVFTTVHCSLLQMLHQENSVAGVADLKYIKLPFIHEQVKKGRIMDCGDSMSPAIEKMIDLRPDAIFLSPFENNGGYGKVDEIDVPVIECADYMERAPLARAEWMRFYGMLFGCEREADSLFAVVDSSYQALKVLAKSVDTKAPKSVLIDKMMGSVWYVPGGQSTIGQMLRDANCRYPWSGDNHSGSVSQSFESVLEEAGECDVWLFRFSNDHLISYDELLNEHHGYSQFHAFQQRRVYGCNVQLSQFYEESPFRPDWLLTDFIKIVHPEISGLPELRYYQRIKE